VDENGDKIWERKYWILPMNDSIMLIGSSKDENGWKINLIQVNNESEVLEKKALVNGVIFDVVSAEKGILLAGEHDREFYVA